MEEGRIEIKRVREINEREGIIGEGGNNRVGRLQGEKGQVGREGRRETWQQFRIKTTFLSSDSSPEGNDIESTCISIYFCYV